MSSIESALVPTNPRRRILWLVLAHIVIGLVVAFGTSFAGRSPSLRGAVFVGVVFGQTSLLGIWGSLGTNPWWKRLVGVIAGIGYLGLVFGVTTSELQVGTFYAVAMWTMFVAMPLLFVRSFRAIIDLAPPFPATVAVGACAGFCLGNREDKSLMTFTAVQAMAMVVSSVHLGGCGHLGYRTVERPAPARVADTIAVVTQRIRLVAPSA